LFSIPHMDPWLIHAVRVKEPHLTRALDFEMISEH
jgi:hypothetical protein